MHSSRSRLRHTGYMSSEQGPRRKPPSAPTIRRITWAIMISIVTLGAVTLRLDVEVPVPVLVVGAALAAIGAVVLVVLTIRALRR